ncbi:ABC transporter ATP-binding protein [Agrobacterium sp. SHOUNA12C]|uniref:Glutathione import ATP-binding protein GsiA n=1 Tax=Rhizobium rhizogenes NBRC 13257 TaxID=1220581 RepID=A0AA87U3F6_RHIRH|nr:ABC transporter ATP-binding protein [Rhizobium rhizogenes]KAA6486445.1 ABC transporter ATP-binding protein [Agrobacterium sp. ICMP 7243]MCJ9719362.1 ABC transporter ATP-binding protein [Agrobacterium sp. BETTINA12B]MCJ9757393.1 ABC transporter ATP-binding protein [Agrobacterium sp. SHOUNA12C]OCI93715.1 peptide ABC transporter ATP-binding protein [Agrobacterium sp. 13-626]NTF50930.1 ABC transporter ATP-binding protein [Rhizobium rhizogenes]
MIEIDNLTIRFAAGQRPVVRNVSFDVEKGTAFGLVGESGCGKSTVLRAVSGLNPNYQGSIELDGDILDRRRDRPFFRRVQMVFQDPYGSLHPRKTIRSQLKEPLRNQGIATGSMDVDALLRSVGLDPSLSYRFPHQLSGGQRQRVAIARALVLNPAVLLLDEPTSALDVSVQAEILNLLDDLRRERGLTYLLVSHDLAVVSHMCSRVAIMEAGEIVEEVDIERLRKGVVEHPYSQRLLRASRMYGKQREVLA